MTTALDHARDLVRRGFAVIPLQHKRKDPTRQGWQTWLIPESELPKHFNGDPANIGLLNGEPSGWIVDVDLDHAAAVELAPDLLPGTRCVFGRDGNPRSHWLYRVTAPVATTKFKPTAGDTRKPLIELRSTGSQTVAPGSTHPSGEPVRWDQDGEPASIGPDELLGCLADLHAAVLNKLGMPSTETRTARGPVARAGGITPFERCRLYLDKLPRAVEGQGGSDPTFQAACMCFEFGLTDGEAAEMMGWWSENKSDPPWPQHQLDHKLRGARAKVVNEGGFGRRLREDAPASVSRQRMGGAPVSAAQAEPPPLRTIRLSEVKAEPISWLWPGRIPSGKLSLLVGEPEAGKSLILADIAGRVSSGAPWPFHTERREPATVLLACPEDGLADTLKPRLEAAGADCSRVLTLDDLDFDLTDVERLEKLIVSERVALMGIDPITGYLPPKADGNDEGSVRALLHPLVAMAERTGMALMGVKHTRKAAADTPLKRVLGAVAWGATARAVWGAAELPDDPDGRVFCKVKMNIAPDPGSLVYTIGSVSLGFDEIRAPMVQWVRVDGELRAADVFRPQSQDGPSGDARASAADFLVEVLRAGPVRQDEVLVRAKAAGIGESTLKRAKKAVGVRSQFKGAVGVPGSGWFWHLPIAREGQP